MVVECLLGDFVAVIERTSEDGTCDSLSVAVVSVCVGRWEVVCALNIFVFVDCLLGDMVAVIERTSECVGVAVVESTGSQYAGQPVVVQYIERIT